MRYKARELRALNLPASRSKENFERGEKRARETVKKKKDRALM